MKPSRAALHIRSSLLALPARSATTVAAPVAEAEPEWSSAKPYSEIPGPKPLPIPKFGNVWRMLPFGTLAGKDMIEIHNFLYSEYGPIVKFGGFGRPDMIMLYDPEDVEKLFRNESAWPVRPGLNSIDYYRHKTRYDIYQGNPGVLSSQGELWQKNRSAVNQPMMKPSNVRNYHNPIQEVASEFIEKIKSRRDQNQEVPKDFSNDLNRWALESISLIALDTRLGCLESNRNKDSDAEVMIASVDAMFDLFFKLDVLPSLWPYISTPDWRRFVKVMNNITGITSKHVNKKLLEIQNRSASDPEGQSILEILLSGEGGKAVAMTMAMDMMMAGIDTTSNSTAVALYYLAKNPEVQEKAFEEVKKALPNLDDDLPIDYGSSIPFLKACIKESQRLSPLAAGNARRIHKDMVMHGFRIPKGTDVGISNRLMCHMEKYFPRPKDYIPERWLKSEKDSPLSATKANPFVFLPFGFGARMCVGRRIAELELNTILSKIIRNFKISYNYGEMTWKAGMLITPSKPLQFQMVDRK